LGGYFDFPNNSSISGSVPQANSLNETWTKEYTVQIMFTIDANGTVGALTDLVIPLAKDNLGGNWAFLAVRNISDSNYGRMSHYVGNNNSFSSTGGALNFPGTGTSGLVLGAWYFAEFKRFSNNTLSFYSNLNNLANFANISTSGFGTQNLIIGRAVSGQPYQMDGKVMYVATYNRALTFDESRQNYNILARRVGLPIK
jgi:hypothetical protein